MLSLWQVARRISKSAFECAVVEQTAKAQVQASEVAKVLDGKQPEFPHASIGRQITADVSKSASRVGRFRPTVVEGIVAVFVAMEILTVFLFFIPSHPASAPAGALGRTPANTTLEAGSSPASGAVERTPEHEAENNRKMDTIASQEQTAAAISAVGSHLVRGSSPAFTLALPASWTIKNTPSDDSDTVLATYKSLSIRLIAEQAQVGTADTIAGVVRKQLKEHATDLLWSDPQPFMLDGRRWLEFVAKCRVGPEHVGYQFYVYSGPEGTYQIIAWTSHSTFDRDADVMRTVMRTFQFPK